MASRTYRFIVTASHGAGPPGDDGRPVNHHLYLEHPETPDFHGQSLNCAQSPLYDGVEPGSTVTITIDEPTDESVHTANQYLRERHVRNVPQPVMVKPPPGR